MLTLSAKLDRSDQNTTWGFRMHGGFDYHAPLSIQKVSYDKFNIYAYYFMTIYPYFLRLIHELWKFQIII